MEEFEEQLAYIESIKAQVAYWNETLKEAEDEANYMLREYYKGGLY